MNILEITDLRVEFDTPAGVVRAVDGVTLSLAPGEVLALVGESGCGKSVTAMSVLRLIPNPPGRIASGAITFDGRDIASLPGAELRKLRGAAAGMVFQDPMTALSPLRKIGSQLIEALQLHQKTTRRDALALARHWLEKCGIADPERVLDAYPFRLSGGQQQRVMIASVLMTSPKLVIADEPTTALDTTIQAQVLDLMRSVKGAETALLLITHNMGIVWQNCPRVAVMYAGEIVEQGSTADILKHPAHPYTKALLDALPSTRLPGERLSAIPGAVPSPLAYPSGCRFAARCVRAQPECRKHHPELINGVRCHFRLGTGDWGLGTGLGTGEWGLGTGLGTGNWGLGTSKDTPASHSADAATQWKASVPASRAQPASRGEETVAFPRPWQSPDPATSSAKEMANETSPLSPRSGEISVAVGCAYSRHPRCETKNQPHPGGVQQNAETTACQSPDPATSAPVPNLVPSPHSPVPNPVPSPQSLTPILAVRNLAKSFKRVRAVDDVSFELRAGETLAIVGESGCGKTTVARIIAGLETPDAGQILLNSAELPHRRRAAQRAAVQMVFQDPFASLNPRMSIGAAITEGAALHGIIPRKERATAARALLESVGLPPEAADRYPHEFSGGQRQRISIARAISMRPAVLLCDEPVSALDVSVQAQVLNLLADLKRATGIACIFITHDIGVVRYVADRVAVMRDGRIVEQGATAEIFAAPRDEHTKHLLAAEPRIGE